MSGHLRTQRAEMSRRRERRRRRRLALWVTFTLLLFGLALGIVVDLMAGDFISSIIDTFVGFAKK
jgi:hypothetical protein